MAPRTRTRNTKVLKENIEVVRKTKVKSDGKVSKPPRKALGDKTNSLSDDNASIDVPIKTSKVALKIRAPNVGQTKDEVRPRRERRLPNRFVENQIFKDLSNSKERSVNNKSSVIFTPDVSPVKPSSKKAKPSSAKLQENVVTNRPRRNGLQPVKEPPKTQKTETPNKHRQSVSSSPFKTPSQSLDRSLVQNRPKRICRLPSKFEDHSVSPSKFIPVHPCHASTPIVQKKTQSKINDVNGENTTKPSLQKRATRKNRNNLKEMSESLDSKHIEHYFSKLETKSSSSKERTSDSNNNKGKKTLTKGLISTKSPKNLSSPKANVKEGIGKRILDRNFSVRVFEDRKIDVKDDVYEFTFDPNEEPKPQKKKRKRAVQKRSAKTKTVVFKNNYEKNLQIALESLKSKIKPSQSQNTQVKPTEPQNTQAQKIHTLNTQQQNKPIVTNAGKIQIIENKVVKPAIENKSLNYTPAQPVNESAKSIHMSNYASIHVEDIAADFEANDTNDFNYSPVNSPCPKTPRDIVEDAPNNSGMVNPNDSLNLQGNVSFFDEQPVASSSMNMSVRHPLASPWRVEFGNLPIRWQANTYVKPNMTPAVESSFVNSEEIGKKKHVYTNMVYDEPLHPMEDSPTLKQTSIYSFMKEVAERSLKKKRGRSISPTKNNSLFDDINYSNTSKEFGYKTPKKPRKEVLATPKVANSSNDKSYEKENLKNIENNENTNGNSNNVENHENINENSNPKENSNNSEKSPKKSKKKNKDNTFFGFDDSESVDQENISPIKNVRHTRARGLRPKSRVLQEINSLSGPTRAILPITATAKLASSEVVEKLYEQIKSTDVAPLFPDPQKSADETAATNDEPSLSDEGQSVHLFEDIEVVHHQKLHRKSYGKAKKVTFRQLSNSDSDTQADVPEARSSDEEDLGDLTFHMPNVKQKKVVKKKKPKNQLSKKEEKEADEWAAGFNSMCEDVDEFPLVVE